MEAVERAGYRPGEDVRIALDAAASEWKTENGYLMPKSGQRLTTGEVIAHFKKLAQDYPIQSMEDPLAEEDYDGFAEITREIGEQVQIVGDDLFVTNPQRLREGIAQGCANAILIKPNQIGTLSETMEAVRLAKAHGYGTILSHRSGETEDTSIADIAVALIARTTEEDRKRFFLQQKAPVHKHVCFREELPPSSMGIKPVNNLFIRPARVGDYIQAKLVYLSGEHSEGLRLCKRVAPA